VIACKIGMADAAFDAMAKRWKLEPYNPEQPRQDSSPIYIELARVQFRASGSEDTTPLSWHLRGSEQKEIDDAWRFTNDPEMKRIRDFFNNA